MDKKNNIVAENEEPLTEAAQFNQQLSALIMTIISVACLGCGILMLFHGGVVVPAVALLVLGGLASLIAYWENAGLKQELAE